MGALQSSARAVSNLRRKGRHLGTTTSSGSQLLAEPKKFPRRRHNVAISLPMNWDPSRGCSFMRQ